MFRQQLVVLNHILCALLARSGADSVLVLCRSYPGNPELRDYLSSALREGLISLPVFVVTLLQAAQSPELHVSATLDMLCKVIIDAHYTSGLPPKSSLVSTSDPPTAVLGPIRDALALLRTAHALPISPFHNLTASVSELIILLLSCATDLTQGSLHTPILIPIRLPKKSSTSLSSSSHGPLRGRQ